MRWMKLWRKRLRALVHTEAVDRELDEELAFHLEMETEKYLRAGLSAEAARRQARLAFPVRDGIPIMLPEEARPLDE